MLDFPQCHVDFDARAFEAFSDAVNARRRPDIPYANRVKTHTARLIKSHRLFEKEQTIGMWLLLLRHIKADLGAPIREDLTGPNAYSNVQRLINYYWTPSRKDQSVNLKEALIVHYYLHLSREMHDHAEAIDIDAFGKSFFALFDLNVPVTESDASEIQEKLGASKSNSARTSTGIIEFENRLETLGGKSKLQERGYSSKVIRILEHGPNILIDDTSLRLSPHEFFIPMPSDTVDHLRGKDGYEDIERLTRESYFGSSDIGTLDTILQIDNVRDKIQPFIESAAHKFRHDLDGVRFNNDLYGLRRIRINTRVHGAEERPKLSAEAYRTNYFTFRVMDEFHRSIVKAEPERSLLSISGQASINDRLYPLVPTIAINGIVTADGGETIVLSFRSPNSALFERPASVHPSFNEALTEPMF